MRWILLLLPLVLAGCVTTEPKAYKPSSSTEKDAFAQADLEVSYKQVQQEFEFNLMKHVAWAGTIKDIQFKEMEREVHVGFSVEHRNFDWLDHGGGKPFVLSSTSDGEFTAGWVVQKPTSITRLKQKASPGDMILVYGKPINERDGVVQLRATAVRPIGAGDFSLAAEAGE